MNKLTKRLNKLEKNMIPEGRVVRVIKELDESEEGAIITSILKARRKSIETQDHEGRIAALEEEKGTRRRT